MSENSFAIGSEKPIQWKNRKQIYTIENTCVELQPSSLMNNDFFQCSKIKNNYNP